MREIKFRAWDKKLKKIRKVFYINFVGWGISVYDEKGNAYDILKDYELIQYTGLKDKNEHLTDIYEGDIISKDGKVIGNQYENPTLLKDKTNLLIQGFGTKTWCATYQKAMERGCTNTK